MHRAGLLARDAARLPRSDPVSQSAIPIMRLAKAAASGSSSFCARAAIAWQSPGKHLIPHRGLPSRSMRRRALPSAVCGDRLVERVRERIVDLQSLVGRMSLQSPHRRAKRHLQRQLATVALRTFRKAPRRRIARSRCAAASALAERSRARSPALAPVITAASQGPPRRSDGQGVRAVKLRFPGSFPRAHGQFCACRSRRRARRSVLYAASCTSACLKM